MVPRIEHIVTLSALFLFLSFLLLRLGKYKFYQSSIDESDIILLIVLSSGGRESFVLLE